MYRIMFYHTSGMIEEKLEKKKPTYEQMRDFVGGLIQYVPIRKRGKEIIVNEEGYCLQLPLNPLQTPLVQGTGWELTPFAGNFLTIEKVKPDEKPLNLGNLKINMFDLRK